MGFWTNLARAIGFGGGSAPAKAQARSVLKDEIAGGYKPTLPGSMFWDGANSTPDLARLFQDAEAMLAHPRVEHALNYYKSGTANAEIVLEDASTPEHGAFLQSEAQRFFKQHRGAAQRSYEYGRGAAECVYDDSDGAMRLSEMHPKLPLDCRALALSGQYAGVRVKGSQKALDLPGPVGPLPAKAFWLAHNRRYSRWYGMPRLYAAWRPWRRLAGRDGAEDIVDGGVYRFAFQPPIGRYPGEDSTPPANDPSAGQAGVRSINRDKMRQMLETLKAGGVVVMSSRTDDKGQYVWDVRYPDGSLDVGGLLAYTADLEKAISLGIGVPPELLEASEVGSGYSGRMIPLEAFYVGQQSNAEEMLLAWYLQIGRPLLWWNFGPKAWGRLAVADLLKTRMKAMKEASGEGQQGPQQPPSPSRPVQLSTFDESKIKRATDGRFGNKAGEHGQGGGQGQGSQGGQSSDPAPEGPQTPAEQEMLGKADQAAEAKVSAFQKALQAIDSVPVVNWITGALGWVKDRTVAFYGFLKERYGPRQAVAIMGSGQLAGWATTGIGLAMGVPLVIPGLSIVASIPAMAAAEVYRQVRGAQKGGEAEPGKTAMSSVPDAAPDPDEVRRAAQEFADKLTGEFVEWLKANPVPDPKGQGGGQDRQPGKAARLSTFDESKVRRATDGRFGDKPGEQGGKGRQEHGPASGSHGDWMRSHEAQQAAWRKWRDARGTPGEKEALAAYEAAQESHKRTDEARTAAREKDVEAIDARLKASMGEAGWKAYQAKREREKKIKAAKADPRLAAIAEARWKEAVASWQEDQAGRAKELAAWEKRKDEADDDVAAWEARLQEARRASEAVEEADPEPQPPDFHALGSVRRAEESGEGLEQALADAQRRWEAARLAPWQDRQKAREAKLEAEIESIEAEEPEPFEEEEPSFDEPEPELDDYLAEAADEDLEDGQ